MTEPVIFEAKFADDLNTLYNTANAVRQHYAHELAWHFSDFTQADLTEGLRRSGTSELIANGVKLPYNPEHKHESVHIHFAEPYRQESRLAMREMFALSHEATDKIAQAQTLLKERGVPLRERGYIVPAETADCISGLLESALPLVLRMKPHNGFFTRPEVIASMRMVNRSGWGIDSYQPPFQSTDCARYLNYLAQQLPSIGDRFFPYTGESTFTPQQIGIHPHQFSAVPLKKTLGIAHRDTVVNIRLPETAGLIHREAVKALLEHCFPAKVVLNETSNNITLSATVSNTPVRAVEQALKAGLDKMTISADRTISFGATPSWESGVRDQGLANSGRQLS